jgi:hypothetical protein
MTIKDVLNSIIQFPLLFILFKDRICGSIIDRRRKEHGGEDPLAILILESYTIHFLSLRSNPLLLRKNHHTMKI